jgi:hypothetical protein
MRVDAKTDAPHVRLKSQGVINALFARGALSSVIVGVVRKFRDQWRVTDYDAVTLCHVISEAELADFIAEVTGFPRVTTIAGDTVDQTVAEEFGRSEAKKLMAIPTRKPGGDLTWVVADPTADGLLETLTRYSQTPFSFAIAERRDIFVAIDVNFPLIHQDK